MPSISVLVDDNEISTAGASELNLLSASVCGSSTGKQSLSVSGIGHMDANENEHLNWVRQQIDVGQSIELRIDHADQFSTAERSVTRGGIDEITQQLESLGEKENKRGSIAPPDILFPGLYYSVRVNSDSPVIALLDGYDQIQAEVMWSRHTPEFSFSVMSISVKPDGNTTQKYWLQTALKSGDQVRIEVRDAPINRSRSAAISVA